jgi:hypothetical protein
MQSSVRTKRVVPLGLLAHALIRACERITDAVATYAIAHRKAKAAEELYRYLSRLSDAELAVRGLNRHLLVQFINERLGPSRPGAR